MYHNPSRVTGSQSAACSDGVGHGGVGRDPEVLEHLDAGHVERADVAGRIVGIVVARFTTPFISISAKKLTSKPKANITK
jgi:hypothetical protein